MNKIVPVLFVFFVLGCSVQEKEKTPAIIKKEELVALLAEIHLAKAGVMVHNASDTMSNAPQTKELLSWHHISEDAYQKTMAYYGSHPEALSELYGEVIAELTRLQAEQSGQINKVQERKDFSNSSAH